MRWAGAASLLLLTGCQLVGLRSTAPESLRTDPSWVLIPELKLVSQRGRHDCGVAALATVIEYWQPTTTTASVAAAIGPADEKAGVAAGRLRTVALRKGLNAFLIEGTVEDLVHEVGRRRPVILGLVGADHGRAYGHYDVVAGVNQTRRLFLLADPRGTWRQVRAEELLTAWGPARHLALVIFP
jgi:ABC-type bacteriocin/lantibiotic exporter with double-glycine peptidase domain